MVALGFQGVGKTSMIIRYIRKVLCEQVRPTIGAAFFTCVLNMENTRVVLKVWDTAGQEKFRSMAPMYYRNANAALLVFDITQYDTFIAMKDWVTELRKNVQESIVLVVIGNKTDLNEERQVDAEEGRAYATKIGASYHETSVVKNEGIDEVFIDVAKGLIRLSSNERDLTSLQVYEGTTLVGPDITGISGTSIATIHGDGGPHNVSIISGMHESHEPLEQSRPCC